MNNGRKYIVGGPARNGKTTLVNILYSQKRPVIGLPIDAHFHLFQFQKYPLISLQKRIILKEWLAQSRRLGEDLRNVATPGQYFVSDFEAILKGVGPKKCQHPLQVIAAALDVFSNDFNSSGWAVHDIHSERLFIEYKKWIPELKLIFVLRDPREAVCASLYWRCYPEKNKKAVDLLQYRTMMWIYSAQTYILLKKLFPYDVTLLCFNALVEGDIQECNKMATCLDTPKDSFQKYFEGKNPYFSYFRKKFITPDNKSKQLLDQSEVRFVEHFTRGYIQHFGWQMLSSYEAAEGPMGEFDKFIRVLDKAALLLNESPEKAKDFIDSNMEFTKEKYVITKKNQWKKEIRRNLRNIVLETIFRNRQQVF